MIMGGSDDQIATERRLRTIDDKRIRYIIHKSNKGGCAARNTGIKNAAGDYIAFLDDDDVWSCDFLKTMVQYFTNKSIGAVYCDFFTFDGRYSKSAVKREVHTGDVHRDILRGWCPISTSLFMVRTSSIVDAGMFDETLPSFQDYDMWLNLSQKYDFAYCEQKLVLKYEGFGEQVSRNPKRRKEGYDLVVSKWEKTLSEEEKDLFQKFKNRYYYDTLYRSIVYNKSHSLNYHEDLAEYFKTKKSLIHRIHILAKLHMSEALYSRLGLLSSRFDKNIICYRGKIAI